MLESLVARARFYDITGYWIPGNVTIIIGWLYAWAFGWREQANRVLAYASDNLVVFGVLIVIVGGYAIGHLVNSVSKLLLEKLVLAGSFKRNRDWLSRLQSDSSSKKDEVMRRFNQEFHYRPTSSASAGGVIQGWAEQQLPAPSMTTFRFLCFYGMNRTLSLLTLLAIPPIAHIVLCYSHLCCMMLTIVLGCAASVLFGFQYLRFVKYYADSLPELLLMKGEVKDESKT